MEVDFWRGKRVLLTGHTGFKGSWLAVWLQTLGAELCGYALTPPTQPNMYEVASVQRGMTSVLGDVRDYGRLHQTLADFRPEIVFHLAAQSVVRESYLRPVENYQTNVMGTVYLLEAVRHVPGVRSVVVVTSDKCYENREWLWGYRESDALGGYDPYSNSKACAELVAAAFRDSFFHPNDYGGHGVALATARAGNVIAGGDWTADALIPDVLRALLHNKVIHIRNPGAVRPWQHVLDALAGYLTLAEALFTQGAKVSEPWNFGPDASSVKTVGWLVEQLLSIWGESVPWEQSRVESFHEHQFLMLDSSKAHWRLGWAPKLSLLETLEHVVGWTRAYQSGTDMRKFTVRAIESYIDGNAGNRSKN